MAKKKAKKKQKRKKREYRKWTETRKHQILNKYAATPDGKKYAYLEKLGIGSSHIFNWRQQLGG